MHPTQAILRCTFVLRGQDYADEFEFADSANAVASAGERIDTMAPGYIHFVHGPIEVWAGHDSETGERIEVSIQYV